MRSSARIVALVWREFKAICALQADRGAYQDFLLAALGKAGRIRQFALCYHHLQSSRANRCVYGRQGQVSPAVVPHIRMVYSQAQADPVQRTNLSLLNVAAVSLLWTLSSSRHFNS